MVWCDMMCEIVIDKQTCMMLSYELMDHYMDYDSLLMLERSATLSHICYRRVDNKSLLLVHLCVVTDKNDRSSAFMLLSAHRLSVPKFY